MTKFCRLVACIKSLSSTSCLIVVAEVFEMVFLDILAAGSGVKFLVVDDYLR